MRAMIATPPRRPVRLGPCDTFDTMATPALTLKSLPLFPLDTVLFPGGRLPLQVFEVRYLDMVGKCQRTGAPFGVVGLQAGREVRAAGAPDEELLSIGTLAHVSELRQPQAGLLHLRCQGSQRFRIDRASRLPHGLWVADVTLLPGDATVSVPDDLRPAADALRQVRRQLAVHAAAESPPPAPAAAEDAEDDAHYADCGWVANRWCELLPLPLPTRQQLMSLDNPLLRLELVSDLLDRVGINGGQR